MGCGEDGGRAWGRLVSVLVDAGERGGGLKRVFEIRGCGLWCLG